MDAVRNVNDITGPSLTAEKFDVANHFYTTTYLRTTPSCYSKISSVRTSGGAVWLKKKFPMELVGDDLLATNIKHIKIAYEKNARNFLLLEINQTSTITENIAAAQIAYDYCGA
ncbi:Enolase [Arthrobotrys entomopaga]|nr:Enolase [Arthrobotrys entomopaga]